MMHTTDSALDLGNPWWTVLGWALVLWIAAAVVWARERHSTRRPGAPRRLACRIADWLRSAARNRGRLRDLDEQAAHRARQRPESGREGHPGSVRAEQGHHDAGGVRPLRGLALTDAELVALARWLDNQTHAVDVRALERAVTQIELVAADVLHRDRVSRRG